MAVIRRRIPILDLGGADALYLGFSVEGNNGAIQITFRGKKWQAALRPTDGLPGGPEGSDDHGWLSGLSDDDHTQYHNDARGDARYPTKATLTAKGDIYVATGSGVVTRRAAGTDDYPLVADSGEADGLRYGGDVTIPGVLNHTGTHKASYGVTPTPRPAALTQTYATASTTHANPTSSALTDNSGGSADATIEAVPDLADSPSSADDLRDDLMASWAPALRNDMADLSAQINDLRNDLLNVKQFLNQEVDYLQLEGTLQ